MSGQKHLNVASDLGAHNMKKCNVLIEKIKQVD